MEIAIISGKGGTGKSSISAAFATLSKKLVLADCDVDAANLYLLFHPTHEEEQIYIGGQKANINQAQCSVCRLCMQHCQFDAIHEQDGRLYISETACDGCKLCARLCPNQAISLIENDKSRLYSGSFRHGKMVYGRLAPGEENSGKLVSMVREKTRQIAKAENLEIILLDGPPGIGCPVISTITGVTHVVIVTEPSISGLHDLKRTVEICLRFHLNTFVIINKYDLNPEMSQQIQQYCRETRIKMAGQIRFDPLLVDAMVHCQSIVEYAPGAQVTAEIQSSFFNVLHGNEYGFPVFEKTNAPAH